jgi:1-acyl-sn-glycerol-3-phosphate acyltransferase
MNQTPSALYRVVVRLTRSYLRLTGFAARDTPLTLGPGYVVCSNHTSAFDPFIIAALASPCAIHFVAKSELFSNRLKQCVMRELLTIPIKRGEPDIGALRSAVRLLSRGGIIGIFPEGKVCAAHADSAYSNPHELRRGAAFIAARAGAFVVPVNILWRRRRLLPLPDVLVGTPITGAGLSAGEIEGEIGRAFDAFWCARDQQSVFVDDVAVESV